MKIVWVVNNIFPQLSVFLKKPLPLSGGWMYGLAKSLSNSGIELTIITTDKNLEVDQQIDGMRFILLKSRVSKLLYDPSMEKKWKKTIELIQPGLVHIHGTEYTIGLPLLQACPDEKYVVSIQGLIGVIAKYYRGGMSVKEILANITIRDIIRRDDIIRAQKKFKKRGKFEKTYLTRIKNVIGRTTWDRHHTQELNTLRNYFFCNESLRFEFYESPKWDSNKAIPNSIFLSQAGYPLKGLHQVLKAVHSIQNEFKNITIRIAGDNIIDKSSLRLSGYGKYIRSLLKKLNLEDNVIFLGPTKTDQMISEYLKCNVFVNPSSIENSPNSLGEAQLLGVPCIASYVGGVPDMITHGENGLMYRFEEIEMLAQFLKQIFTDDDLAQKLSKNGIKSASKRHNTHTNLKNTLSIYQRIIS